MHPVPLRDIDVPATVARPLPFSALRRLRQRPPPSVGPCRRFAPALFFSRARLGRPVQARPGLGQADPSVGPSPHGEPARPARDRDRRGRDQPTRRPARPTSRTAEARVRYGVPAPALSQAWGRRPAVWGRTHEAPGARLLHPLYPAGGRIEYPAADDVRPSPPTAFAARMEHRKRNLHFLFMADIISRSAPCVRAGDCGGTYKHLQNLKEIVTLHY